MEKLGEGNRKVIITQGKDSTVVAEGDSVIEYPVTPIDANLIVDTNGAGDAFVGGFLGMLALEQPLEKCVNVGHYAAGEIIKASGCMLPANPPSYE